MKENIRVIDSEIGPVIPVVDICELIGYSRSSLDRAIKGHTEKISPCQTFVTLPSSGGPQRFMCLNRKGMDYLFMIIHPSKSKMSLDELLEFRMATLARLGAEPPTLAEHQQGSALKDALIRNADIADVLIERYKYNPDTARSLAMAAVVEEVGEPAKPYRGPAMLPPPALPAGEMADMADPDFDRYFPLKKVAEMTRQTEDRVRNIFEIAGILAFANGIWHLTKLGEDFGKVFVYYPLYPHRMIEKKTIRYGPAAVDLVRRMSGQTELTGEGQGEARLARG